MAIIRRKFYLIFLVVVLALVSGCAEMGNSGDTRYENGYYSEKLPYTYKDVYKATLDAIHTGQTYDKNGNTYDIKINKEQDNGAIIEAFSSSDSSDYLEVIIKEISEDNTLIKIKYGVNGDSIRSSALVNLIDGNIKYGSN